MTKNIIFACAIFTLFAQAVELSDFEPLFREARIKKEIPQELKSKKDFALKDSKAFYDTPQLKILQLIKTYQKEHFRFNATLENIAQQEIQKLSKYTQETQSKEMQSKELQEIQPQEIQKLINDFITNYQKAQRIWLFNILAAFYDEEFFANEVYKNQSKNKKYKQIIATLVNEFFGEQERFILSGGDEILGIIFIQPFNNEVCMELSCGHPTEVFLLDNAYNALKTPKNQAKLKEIADFGFQGYKRYILLKSIKSDEISTILKGLNYENLILTNPSKKQFDDLKAEFDIDSNAILESFITHFARWYLGELYFAKYALALSAKRANAKDIVNDNEGFCQISKYLDKNSQKLCIEKIDIDQEWLYVNDKQVCVLIAQGNIIKSPTNHTPLCKAIQKEVQKQFNKNQMKQDSSD